MLQVVEADSLGGRIRQRRNAKLLSLQELAVTIGCTKAHVWDIERGRSTNPGATLLLGLSAAFGCSVDWLLTGRASDYERGYAAGIGAAQKAVTALMSGAGKAKESGDGG